ncbi:MAG: SHOCT domain-containing protein [Anaerolineales bacterium]|jgi:putative membrane protein
MMGFGMGFGIFGLILTILFWGALIFLAVWLVQSLFGNRRQTQPPAAHREPTPREILDQRYARGEITREQYELMKKDLE